jgi:hypothetical protein
MRNWYNRKYIVIHEPITHRRGRLFERKLAEAEKHGFVPVGNPCFFRVENKDGTISIYGTILMVSIDG